MDAKKEFEQPWSHLRPKLVEIIERHGATAPTTFDEILPMVEPEGGLVWGIGQGLYGRAATGDTSQAAVRDFMAKCPPFRAVCYAFVLAWFDRSLADRHKREKYTAGRVDLFMAIYLPYCDQFISLRATECKRSAFARLHASRSCQRRFDPTMTSATACW